MDLNSDFFIQASNPRNRGYLNRSGLEAEELSTVLELEVFPLNCEDFFIVWKNSWYRLSYKYSLTFMIDDILSLRTKMDKPSGKHTISWPVQEFPLNWTFIWNSTGKLKIKSINRREGPDRMSPELDGESEIQTTIKKFWEEWKKPLLNCQIAIAECGFSDDQVIGLSELKSLISHIPRFGFLYRKGG